MQQAMSFSISGKLPGLNEIVASNRSHRIKGANLKRDTEQFIEFEIKSAYPPELLPHFTGPVRILFRYFEPDKRRDPDNISSAARKFILDTLVRMEILAGDSWAHLTTPLPFFEQFLVDAETPRIDVTIFSTGGEDLTETLKE